MSFQRSADSWRSKAHLSGVRLPLLVGLTAVALCVVAGAGAALASVAATDGLSIVSEEETSSGEGDAGSGDQGSGGAEEAAAADTVVVYVTGAVAAPGVCELVEGSRVQDAISAVGGFTDEAATDALNLARVLEDGEQIDVPTLEEQEEAEESGTELSTSGADPGSSSSTGSSGLVNINTADAAELETLPGIGEVTAEKIIADREANGAYASIEDITRVSGIGDKKFEAIADLICV